MHIGIEQILNTCIIMVAELLFYLQAHKTWEMAFRSQQKWEENHTFTWFQDRSHILKIRTNNRETFCFLFHIHQSSIMYVWVISIFWVKFMLFQHKSIFWPLICKMYKQNAKSEPKKCHYSKTILHRFEQFLFTIFFSFSLKW